jgi:hypothetical protein
VPGTPEKYGGFIAVATGGNDKKPGGATRNASGLNKLSRGDFRDRKKEGCPDVEAEKKQREVEERLEEGSVSRRKIEGRREVKERSTELSCSEHAMGADAFCFARGLREFKGCSERDAGRSSRWV